jgi:hypothetical protein
LQKIIQWRNREGRKNQEGLISDCHERKNQEGLIADFTKKRRLQKTFLVYPPNCLTLPAKKQEGLISELHKKIRTFQKTFLV